ncbi:VCBS repeat-containing protein [Phaeobacter sp. B1627]|uniref:FG-GAP repeat domain-containing protein n=1 Tax=Phaeobacter sp. B1627 TaxID=2583809 RepID=UPI0021072756|nr:VCBS repeat-containing protein [Phaeobacter sp. B1627]
MARRRPLRALRPCARRAAQIGCLWQIGCLCLCLMGFGGVALAGAAPGETRIVGAEFTSPTRRYDHGVLGDAVEFGRLLIHVENTGASAAAAVSRTTLSVTLPPSRVFEDLAPRLWDVTGDALPEVVVIETDLAAGAQLAIYSADGGKFAATPHIGRSHRWLAPIGAADLDGDGFIEIAYIDRPHLARVLRIWRVRDGQLQQIASATGLTNHKIGEAVITSGIRDCGQGPEIVTVNGNWSRVVASRLVKGEIRSHDIGAFDPHLRLTAVLACRSQ